MSWQPSNKCKNLCKNLFEKEGKCSHYEKLGHCAGAGTQDKKEDGHCNLAIWVEQNEK